MSVTIGTNEVAIDKEQINSLQAAIRSTTLSSVAMDNARYASLPLRRRFETPYKEATLQTQLVSPCSIWPALQRNVGTEANGDINSAAQIKTIAAAQEFGVNLSADDAQ